MAKFDYKHSDAVLAALCSEAENKISGFNPQNIANTRNAMAKSGYKHSDAVLAALCSEAENKISD